MLRALLGHRVSLRGGIAVVLGHFKTMFDKLGPGVERNGSLTLRDILSFNAQVMIDVRIPTPSRTNPAQTPIASQIAVKVSEQTVALVSSAIIFKVHCP